MVVPMIAAALLLAAAFVTDVWRMIIPNKLTLSFIATGVVYQLIDAGWAGAKTALLGAAAGAFPLLLLYAAKGIGAGDVKLFGALGVWIGPAFVWQILLYSILYAGAIGLLLLFVSRPFARRMLSGAAAIVVPGMGLGKDGWLSWVGGGKRFPFMLAVLPGAVTAGWFML